MDFAIILLSILLFCASALAQNFTDPIGTAKAAENYVLTAPVGVFGAILIIGGLLFLFFGYRLFKIICFLAGFYLGACLAYIILVNVEPIGGYAHREIVFLLVGIAVGILVGLLFMCIWRLGLSAIGGFAGFTLALFILSWKSGGVIETSTGRAIFIAILVLIGAIVIIFLEKPILIGSTAFAGAFSIVYGVDAFAHKGFSQAVQAFLGQSTIQTIYNATPEVYGMLASILVIAIIGIIVQYRAWGKHEHRKGYRN